MTVGALRLALEKYPLECEVVVATADDHGGGRSSLIDIEGVTEIYLDQTGRVVILGLHQATCRKCSGSGRIGPDYCDCAMGLDLKRVEMGRTQRTLQRL